MALAFGVGISNLITKPRSSKFSPIFWKFYGCEFYIWVYDPFSFFVKSVRSTFFHITPPWPLILYLYIKPSFLEIVFWLSSYLSSLLPFTICPALPLIHMVQDFPSYFSFPSLPTVSTAFIFSDFQHPDV